MNRPRGSPAAAAAWLRLPKTIEDAIDGLTERDLDQRGGPERWSIRETVHHLVESNLIASNIVIAALATNGGAYDWSWVMPGRAWMKRVGYDSARVGPALELLQAICRHVSALLSAANGAWLRKVRLLDAPGAKLRATTVEQILRQEVEHARDHLREVAETRTRHGRQGRQRPSARARRRRAPPKPRPT